MCDYSLHNVKTRPAKVGDKLITRDFGTGSPAKARTTRSLWPAAAMASPIRPAVSGATCCSTRTSATAAYPAPQSATGPGGSAHASTQVTIAPATPPAAVREPSQDEISSDQQQMRGLDEQIQEIKSDALRMSAELSQLEEKLLYPSGTQVAIFVALAKGDQMRLDAVRLQIDGQLVAHYIYSAKELEALRKGGVQRIYVGNVATGDHQLNVLVDGKLKGGADFNRTEHFTFHKEVKPKLV